MRVLATFTQDKSRFATCFSAKILELPADDSPPVRLAIAWIRGLLHVRAPHNRTEGGLELRVLEEWF